MKAKAIFASLNGSATVDMVYGAASKAVLKERLDFAPSFHAKEDLVRHGDEWKDVEYFFTTWGAPQLSEEELAEHFPKLKAVFYGAGSVQYFCRPYLNRGIRVFTANEALSVPVVDFTLAQIFLAHKGYFQAVTRYRSGSFEAGKKYSANAPGNEGTTVGILGAGRIGRGVIGKLNKGRVKIAVYDPFLKAEAAAELGAKKAETLEEIFSSCFVISNHLANNEQTKGMIQYRHFSLMHDYGVFINTGRGAQIVESDLVRAFKEKPTRTALLDVTWPEPIGRDHPFLGMDNVLISPHLAGTMSNEHIWLGEYIAGEFLCLLDGKPLRSEVTEDMLLTMA